MNIDEYLCFIDRLSQKEVEEELLMQNNFSIALKGGICKIMNSQIFKKSFFGGVEKNARYSFNHRTGSLIHLLDELVLSLPSLFPKIDFRSYNTTAVLHLSERYSQSRGYTAINSGIEMLKDITLIAKSEKMPFCLPDTFHLNACGGLVLYVPNISQ